MLLLWNRRRLVVFVMLAAGLCGFIISFFMTPIFTAETTILPQPGFEGGGIISDVAAMAGISLREETNYENLYGRIIKSDQVLNALLSGEWTVVDDKNIDLYGLLGFEKPVAADSLKTIFKLKQRLREDVISFYRDDRTGYMILKVHVPRHPTVAADIANGLVAQLDEYNRVIRNSRAREQRVFIESQYMEMQQQLRDAENSLADFVARNRSYASSPSLLLEYEVLQREIRVREMVWTELRRQLELARIEENRNLVAVEVLDPATPPVRRSSPRRGLIALAGMVIGGIAVGLYLVSRRLLAGDISGSRSGAAP